MRLTALLLVSLCAWIHITESASDASTMYPEDWDDSGDDQEGSGSGDEEKVTNTTEAPATSLTPVVSVSTEQEGIPIGSAGETTAKIPDARSTGAVSNVGSTEAATKTKMTATTAAANPAVAIDAEVASTTPGTAPSTAAPVEVTTTKVPWELPVDPLRETSSVSAAEGTETMPPDVMGTSTPKDTESGGAETTSSSSTAVPPPVVDTGIEASTRTSVLTEEDGEGEEEGEEEGSPAPGSTLGTDFIDTTPDDMASGDGPTPESVDLSQTTASAKPAIPEIPVEDVIQSKSNVNVEAAIPDDSDIIMEDPANAEPAFAENGSLLERKEVLGGVIAGGVVGLAFAIMLVSLMVYRMKKKDEGSYSLDDHKQHPNGYQKARREEEFLA